MKSGNHPDRFLPSVASFLLQSFFFFFWTTCSAHTSTQCFFLNLRIKEGSLIIECQYQDHVMKDVTYHSSDAIPKSLQHRINALLLHPSDAVGKLVMSKKSCSPLAWDTNLYLHCQYHHLEPVTNTVPSMANECIFSRNVLLVDGMITTWCKTPTYNTL